MTFFRDLSQFRYVDRPEVQSAVNIGWLSPFWYCPIGRTTPEFRDKLFELCAEPRYATVDATPACSVSANSDRVPSHHSAVASLLSVAAPIRMWRPPSSIITSLGIGTALPRVLSMPF
jgi:hypothetical protein